LDFLGVIELTPPAREIARLGFAAVLLQFEESQQQVAQSGHDVSARALADAASIFAQADIPTVMSTVFNGSPVVANALQQLPSTVLLGGGAGAVEAVFFGLLDHFAGAKFLALPPDGQELPATAQPGFFGADADPLNAPAHQTTVLLEPTGIVFSGKKKAAATGFAPAPKSRFGCL
jgi:hypothetical protein